MPISTYLRYLLLPATNLTVVVFIVVISLAFAIAVYGGLFALPLDLWLALSLFNYGFVLLEAIANGAREAPVLAIEMLNPVHEWRPVFQLALVLIVATLLSVVAVFVDAPLAAALAFLGFLALPASTAALAVGSSVWQSMHPGAVWHIARTLGVHYAAVVAVVVAYGFGLWWLARADVLPMWPLCALVTFAWLSVFTLIGGNLYEHRELLGHDAIDSPERRAARVQYEVDRERNRFVDRFHAQARGGNLPGAWQTIERELAACNHSFEFYDWLLTRLTEREDQRLAYRLAQDYISRALGRDNARAAAVAQRALQRDPDFRPRSGAQCLRVADLLRLAGDRPGAQRLLGEFASHFPNDPAIADAENLLATLTRR
jgi:hypothetical protein